MSLYHEAALVLDKASAADSGSIESIVFGKKDWKSPAKTLFALSCETAKWSRILSDCIERSELLKNEKQLTATLALALAHDLLLAKRGLALPKDHGLVKCIGRHKTRLSAELTKARLREGCASIDELRSKVERESAVQTSGSNSSYRPRWIRINRVLTTTEEQIGTTFADYERVASIADLFRHDSGDKRDSIYLDEHIPDLVAVAPTGTLARSKAYKEGKIIFQDKASCFPAYLLDYDPNHGRAIDGCAAPGNKTTHLAALTAERLGDVSTKRQLIIACEKDALRSQTLTKMVKLAGADRLVQVRLKQNFLQLDPQGREFADVTALLLDPSCSGSGIVGRDEGGVHIFLPSSAAALSQQASPSKKRKRGAEAPVQLSDADAENDVSLDEQQDEILAERLAFLAEFQLRLLQHAMSFPTAERITYSTCSVHARENEEVVCKALHSNIAQERGWQILARNQQVKGMKDWHIRGDLAAARAFHTSQLSTSGMQTGQEIAEACIRCEKSGKDGTMGFFVAAFIRSASHAASNGTGIHKETDDAIESDDPDWDGFDED